MTSKPVAYLLADLGISKSYIRPHVSNDSPFSEAQLKTLKYRSDFPSRFGSIEDARAFCCSFFSWSRYAGDIRAGHRGRAEEVRAKRAIVLTDAYSAHAERFVCKHPEPPPLPGPVCSWSTGTRLALHLLVRRRPTVRITSKGQVTIPQDIREAAGLLPNTEVEFVMGQDGVRIVKKRDPARPTRGASALDRLRRSSGTVAMSTEEIMSLTRGEE